VRAKRVFKRIDHPNGNIEAGEKARTRKDKGLKESPEGEVGHCGCPNTRTSPGGGGVKQR